MIHVQLMPFFALNKPLGFILPDEAMKGKYIQPNSYGEVGTVIFAPPAVGDNYATTLYIKNNLTILDAIAVRGMVGNR